MSRVILLLAALVAAGCGSTPYAEAFVGYRLSEGGGFESCSKENAGIRLGAEWEFQDGYSLSAEYEHISHLLCGRPWTGAGNEADEYADHAGLKLRKEWK